MGSDQSAYFDTFRGHGTGMGNELSESEKEAVAFYEEDDE